VRENELQERFVKRNEENNFLENALNEAKEQKKKLEKKEA